MVTNHSNVCRGREGGRERRKEGRREGGRERKGGRKIEKKEQYVRREGEMKRARKGERERW